MGVRVDLVDRSVYFVDPNHNEIKNEAKPASTEEVTEAVLKDLRNKLFNGIDRWLLSDIETIPEVTMQKKKLGDSA